MAVKRSCLQPRQPLLWKKGTKLSTALWPASMEHQCVVSPRDAASPGSPKFGNAPLAAGLTTLTALDLVGQPKAFFLCLSNMYHGKRYCFMKYLLCLITTLGFLELWHWLTDTHVVSDCLLLRFSCSHLSNRSLNY